MVIVLVALRQLVKKFDGELLYIKYTIDFVFWYKFLGIRKILTTDGVSVDKRNEWKQPLCLKIKLLH
jgi:hypothetical protein